MSLKNISFIIEIFYHLRHGNKNMIHFWRLACVVYSGIYLKAYYNDTRGLVDHHQSRY